MHIDILPVGPLQTNAYLATCSATKEAVLIDPGWNDKSLLEAIKVREAKLKYIVNTHAHFDHIGGNAAMVEATGAPLLIHEGELALLQRKGGADMWHIPMQPSPEPDSFLSPGDILEVGELRFKILFTPGHTPGHISLYEANKQALFDGDVLFRRGIGRADLPGGDARQLLESIKTVLLELPDEVHVYPGHGAPTTIGEERVSNPWLR